MQCYESAAIRIKIHQDLLLLEPCVPVDDSLLGDIIDEFNIEAFEDLNTMSAQYYELLLNEALSAIDPTIRNAA